MRSFIVLSALCSLMLAGLPALGQVNRELPEVQGVGVTEKLGAQIPLDLSFTDENGQPVRLGNYFKPGRPVILTLNYYACPMLCTVQLNGMIAGLKEMNWTPGQQFEIVTVSFNPNETATLARLKKQNYLKEYGRPEAAAGWHFLTGRQENIKQLTETVGFGYKWDPKTQQYLHAAAAIICTPDGKVSRYLKTVIYDGNTLRMALTEANEGKYRSTVDEILLLCYMYDAEAGRYVIAARTIMRIGGILTVVILGAVLGTAWIREARRSKRAAQAPKEHSLHE